MLLKYFLKSFAFRFINYKINFKVLFNFFIKRKCILYVYEYVKKIKYLLLFCLILPIIMLCIHTE